VEANNLVQYPSASELKKYFETLGEKTIYLKANEDETIVTIVTVDNKDNVRFRNLIFTWDRRCKRKPRGNYHLSEAFTIKKSELLKILEKLQ